MLFPLTLPPTIPLWQVGIGIAFGVVLGKEVFGGTGMNFLNPALTARAFLFFAYPAQISGDQVWIAANTNGVDGVSGATWLAKAAVDPNALAGLNWSEAFVGFLPGSMGETSTLACLLGAVVLIVSKVGSWRTMLGVVVGTAAMATLLNQADSSTNPMMAVPFHWHMVLGGWAFGMVFMATDPVSSAVHEHRPLPLRAVHWSAGCFGSRRQPGLPRGHDARDSVHEHVRPLLDHYVVQETSNENRT